MIKIIKYIIKENFKIFTDVQKRNGLREKLIKAIDPCFSLPFEFSFTLSNRCNLRCGFCPKIICGVEDKEMNQKTLELVVKLAKKIGKINILGLGEPLVNSNFLEVIKKLKDNQAKISFTTNGLLLNEEIDRELIRLEVNEIIFSIEGVKKETHQIFKNSNLKKLITNIRELNLIKKKLRARFPKLSFNFVGMTNNIKELPELVYLAHQLGVEQIYMGNIMALDKNTCHHHLHQNPSIATYYIKKAEKISKKLNIVFTIYASLSPYPISCAWYNRPHIGLDGDVYPCNFIGAQDSLKSLQTIWYEDVFIKINIHNFRLGNILNEKLERIWNNQKIRKLRKIIFESLNEDEKLNWSPKRYRNLLLRYQGRELTPEEFCRICPHRFRITH